MQSAKRLREGYERATCTWAKKQAAEKFLSVACNNAGMRYNAVNRRGLTLRGKALF